MIYLRWLKKGRSIPDMKHKKFVVKSKLSQTYGQVDVSTVEKVTYKVRDLSVNSTYTFFDYPEDCLTFSDPLLKVKLLANDYPNSNIIVILHLKDGFNMRPYIRYNTVTGLLFFYNLLVDDPEPYYQSFYVPDGDLDYALF